MNDLMELNKETALRLWTQQFGSKQKAFDFSGREIARAAYNNRDSKFGWNVDHIMPQSRGGKTADHNLVCCHILTNDEKADKFPCFKANGKEYRIEKRQNHYEIIPAVEESNTKNPQPKKSKTINFYDAAQGLKYWDSYQESDSKLFVGYAKIEVQLNQSTYYSRRRIGDSSASDDFLDRYLRFLKKIFGKDYVFLEKASGYSTRYIFTVIDSSVDTKEETENLLDKCVLLNTYTDYFVSHQKCQSICIVCGMKCYDDNKGLAENFKRDIINKQVSFQYKMSIDELIKINTTANDKVSKGYYSEFYEYNYVFTKLQEDLKKQN
jgi:hypothetical protein